MTDESMFQGTKIVSQAPMEKLHSFSIYLIGLSTSGQILKAENKVVRNA